VFIKTAKRFGYDSVTISNVHKASEVKELRNLMGEDCNMKILVKITTKEAVDNFKEIVSESDGIIIARAYILV
jgi:pyruvate kinase